MITNKYIIDDSPNEISRIFEDLSITERFNEILPSPLFHPASPLKPNSHSKSRKRGHITRLDSNSRSINLNDNNDDGNANDRKYLKLNNEKSKTSNFQDMLSSWEIRFKHKLNEDLIKEQEDVNKFIEIKKLNETNDTRILIDEIKKRIVIRRESVQNVISKVQEERKRKAKEEEDARRKAEDIEKKRIEEQKRKVAEEKKRKEEEEEAERKRKELEKKRKDEIEKKRRDEIEKKQKEEENKKKKQEEEEKLKKASKVGFKNSREIEREFLKQKQKIQDIKININEKVKQQKELKKVTFNIKRMTNIKFGQLTTEKKQMDVEFNVIMKILSQIQGNQLVYHWILNSMAKAIVAQAASEVMASPPKSLPLATFTTMLIVKHPELYEFLEARFVKRCPYVIGYCCSIDTEEGRYRMGWRKEKDVWEDEAKYRDRMVGICTVWSVLTRIQSSGEFAQSQPPFPISKSWSFLARQLNLSVDLLTDVNFAVVLAWWDSTAKEFLTAYGKQAEKLLKSVCYDWTDTVSGKSFPYAISLRLIGDDWFTKRKMASFKPME